MGQFGQASVEDDGGDTSVVFVLCPAFRIVHISEVALQMGAFVFYCSGYGVRGNKYP